MLEETNIISSRMFSRKKKLMKIGFDDFFFDGGKVGRKKKESVNNNSANSNILCLKPIHLIIGTALCGSESLLDL